MIRRITRFAPTIALLAALVALLLPEAATQARVMTLWSWEGKPVHCVDADRMRRLPCPDSTQFLAEGELPLQEAFIQGNYDTLERLYAKWCKGEDRFADGRWKLAWYVTAFSARFKGSANWDGELRDIRKWQKARPGSDAARLAEAVYWRGHAWHARGTGYSRTVSKEGWRLFAQRLERAYEVLQTIGAGCAAKYPLILDTLIDAGAPESVLRPIFAEASAAYPRYHNIYFSMARRFEPKWGGSVEDYERFAREAVEATATFEGKGMYARLYWLVDYDSGIPFARGISDMPEWGTLRQGFNDLLERYPNSQHNLGQFLNVACRSADADLYRSLRAKLGPYAGTGSTYDPIEVCDMRHRWHADAAPLKPGP